MMTNRQTDSKILSVKLTVKRYYVIIAYSAFVFSFFYKNDTFSYNSSFGFHFISYQWRSEIFLTTLLAKVPQKSIFI